MSWVQGADGSGFGTENLPYGIVERPADGPRPAVRIGEHAVDLRRLAETGLIDVPAGTFAGATLNRFIALGPATWTAVREELTEHLADGSASADRIVPTLLPLDDVGSRLPVAVGDYIDFYASRQHAENLGRLFRPDSPSLLPNWCHLPVGYHGRSSTIVVSGTPVRRPVGQRAPETAGATPTVGPERRLDFELELGFITGNGPALGIPIPVDDAPEHIFGIVLVNDWTAREIQRWEYQPLGPFLGKSFATSISPWIVPLDALETQRTPGPVQDPAPPAYLRSDQAWGLDIALAAALQPTGSATSTTITQTNASALYWSVAQQLAHASANGAVVRAGDLFASGTISGDQPDSYGSMIELAWDGTSPITVDGGHQRAFLEDGDSLTMSGRSGRISLGEVTGTILPANT